MDYVSWAAGACAAFIARRRTGYGLHKIFGKYPQIARETLAFSSEWLGWILHTWVSNIALAGSQKKMRESRVACGARVLTRS